MERHEPTPEPSGAAAEREPQPRDVALAATEVLREYAAETDPQDIEDGLATIEEAVDLEEALGAAAGLFAMLCDDRDQALRQLGAILQTERIAPNPIQDNDE